MGKLVFGMMQSLDGYVAGVAGGPGSDGYVAGLASGLELPPPGVLLGRHFNDHVRGLIDEYRLYFRPFVLGRGKPYFAGARPPLRLIAADPVGEDAVRLTYVPT